MNIESIRVYHGMAIDWCGQSAKLNIQEIIPKFPNCYAVNNSTVALILGDEMFVAPWTKEVAEAIESFGMKEAAFHVPFSNGDFPIIEKDRWEELREKARESYRRDFERNCAAWCNRHHIKVLDKQIMNDCFRIPVEGIAIKHPYYESTVYPECNTLCMDSSVTDKLGKFCYNNGKVVFVSRDGNTYVAKGYGILNALRAARYKEEGLFVPFSNGEQIIDPQLRALWESLPKF